MGRDNVLSLRSHDVEVWAALKGESMVSMTRREGDEQG